MTFSSFPITTFTPGNKKRVGVSTNAIERELLKVCGILAGDKMDDADRCKIMLCGDETQAKAHRHTFVCVSVGIGLWLCTLLHYSILSGVLLFYQLYL